MTHNFLYDYLCDQTDQYTEKQDFHCSLFVIARDINRISHTENLSQFHSRVYLLNNSSPLEAVNSCFPADGWSKQSIEEQKRCAQLSQKPS